MGWVEVTWIELSLDYVKGTDVELGCALGASPAHEPPHVALFIVSSLQPVLVQFGVYYWTLCEASTKGNNKRRKTNLFNHLIFVRFERTDI